MLLFMYLIFLKYVYPGHSGSDVPDIQYANWVSMVLAGVKGLEMFSPASGEWKQAHSQARFVLLHVMLNAGEGFVDVKEVCSNLYYHYYYYINYCLL